MFCLPALAVHDDEERDGSDDRSHNAARSEVSKTALIDPHIGTASQLQPTVARSHDDICKMLRGRT